MPMSSSHAALGCLPETRRVSLRQAEDEDDRRKRDDDGKPRAQHVVGSVGDSEQQQQTGGHEGEHVDRAGQEEQPARASHDLPCRTCRRGEAASRRRRANRRRRPAAARPSPSGTRPSRAPTVVGTGLKNSRKMTTKLRHDASSKARAAATSAGFMSAISPHHRTQIGDREQHGDHAHGEHQDGQ